MSNSYAGGEMDPQACYAGLYDKICILGMTIMCCQMMDTITKKFLPFPTSRHTQCMYFKVKHLMASKGSSTYIIVFKRRVKL